MEFFRILSIIYYYNEIITYLHLNCFTPGLNKNQYLEITLFYLYLGITN